MTPQSIAGFLVLDKSTGISSMKALARVRVLARDTAKGAKSGHAGTLDPLASGVLVIGIGRPATRLLSRIVGASKRYRTEIDLSGFTPSDDLESDVEPVSIETPPTRDHILSTLSRFEGDIMQSPPAFSAIKVDGKRAYQLARENKLDSLPARPTRVHELSLVDYSWPTITVDIHCGKGFYVRSLARELGGALGTGGYCLSIRRTAVGPFDLQQARTLSALPDSIEESDLIGIEDALSLLECDIDVRGGEPA
ncbi:MAG: tRNA pseudouridine(55) synthase TruB [Phycisphaerae bacterium]|nr:tRNA pseudouridine(55) synthase TruB [Phycisphaerae bacterium]|tara:strand:+ start:2509 stop:3264 length:756 start_codon:yes stop_codon:yes gene_type:complete